MIWKGRAQEWLFDHGLELDADGILLIPRSKVKTMQYIEWNICGRRRKTLSVPTDYGMVLLNERHFRVIPG